jgi:hypothetical protein
MQQWVLDAEDILNGSWAEVQEQHDKNASSSKEKCVTNKEVGIRFDTFIQGLEYSFAEGVMSQTERECLEQFLQVLKNLRPHLIQCYDLEGFPRTNNEMEGAIRKIKTSYRRISGRKNWNAFLLRHGRNVAFYAWWGADPERWRQFEKLAQHIDREQWRQIQKETTTAQSEQLKRFRFLHKRKAFLAELENRWVAASETRSLH